MSKTAAAEAVLSFLHLLRISDFEFRWDFGFPGAPSTESVEERRTKLIRVLPESWPVLPVSSQRQGTGVNGPYQLPQ